MWLVSITGEFELASYLKSSKVTMADVAERLKGFDPVYVLKLIGDFLGEPWISASIDQFKYHVLSWVKNKRERKKNVSEKTVTHFFLFVCMNGWMVTRSNHWMTTLTTFSSTVTVNVSLLKWNETKRKTTKHRQGFGNRLFICELNGLDQFSPSPTAALDCISGNYGEYSSLVSPSSSSSFHPTHHINLHLQTGTGRRKQLFQLVC